MLASGNFLWNAGIFLVSVRRFVTHLRQHAPEMMVPAKAALDGAEQDLGFRRFDKAPSHNAQNFARLRDHGKGG